ncbi:alpha-ketoglutarate-dependent dioxygenase AlkB [Lacibacterium aquatile]|uniref:Alpha-ketoglutarate-dependent dioxygenase AlkB n=1 Tax=Lacibacterium aquatile TaxID=1168082 RepID=A0ABW5DTW6_9PROT
MLDLFGRSPALIAPGVVLLTAFSDVAVLKSQIEAVSLLAPFRHMTTPGGRPMGAAMTNCGPLGWVGDRNGYRYEATDPLTGRPWPEMPSAFMTLARRAAETAGFGNFKPDACLINRYAVGVGMGMHRDVDELDREAPIVSVSLGLTARFVIRIEGKLQKIELNEGDVLVFGGPAREAEHGVRPVRHREDSQPTDFRFNLTLRKAR